MIGAAQPAVPAPQVLDMSAIESASATVGVSLEYPTVIEFGEMSIESVEASERGQILAEVGGNTVTIRANREEVDTEFAVSLIGGPTVRFTFVSDPGAEGPTRYVVRSEQPSVSAAEESAEAETVAEATQAEAAEAEAEASEVEVEEAQAEEAEVAAEETQAEETEPEASEVEAVEEETQASETQAEEAAEAEEAEVEASEAEAEETQVEAEAEVIAEEEAAAVAAAAAEARAAAEAAAEARAAATEAQAAAAEMSRADGSGDLLSPLEVEALPPELEFRTSAYQPDPGSMVVQYVLTNGTQNLLAHDPQRLRIYADGETVPFEQVLPAAGQSRRLPAGEVEYGEIFVPNVSANVSDLILEWELVEIGPGITYRADSNLITSLSEAPLFTPRIAVAEQDAATPPQATPSQSAEPTAEPEAPAAAPSAAPSDAQPTTQAATPSTADEAEQLLPPEILAEIRRRGSDITVIGGSFDEPEMNIAEEGAEVTGVSELGTWSLYTRERAEADAMVEGGEACIDVGGESTLFQVQDIGFGYAGFPLTKGRTYRLTFEAYADKPVFFRSLVGLAVSPYSESFARVEALSTQEQTFFYTFEARNDSDLNRVAFLLGGNQASSFRICFDNIVLSEAGEVAQNRVSDE